MNKKENLLLVKQAITDAGLYVITSEDIENLGDKIAQTVLEKTGVQLEWEIIKLGKMNSE